MASSLKWRQTSLNKPAHQHSCAGLLLPDGSTGRGRYSATAIPVQFFRFDSCNGSVRHSRSHTVNSRDVPIPVTATHTSPTAHIHRAQAPQTRDNKRVGRLGNLVNPILFVVLFVATALAWQRRTLRETLPLFAGRVALALALSWLLTHPQKLWHSFPKDFDVSSHTAFFVVPSIALCALNARWWRLLLPLGLLYAVFMAYFAFHTWPELILTALVVGFTTTLCFVSGRRLRNVEPPLVNSQV